MDDPIVGGWVDKIICAVFIQDAEKLNQARARLKASQWRRRTERTRRLSRKTNSRQTRGNNMQLEELPSNAEVSSLHLFGIQVGPSGWTKPPVDLYMGCSTILPGQWVASVAANQLPELSELSQRVVFTVQMGFHCSVLFKHCRKWPSCKMLFSHIDLFSQEEFR